MYDGRASMGKYLDKALVAQHGPSERFRSLGKAPRPRAKELVDKVFVLSEAYVQQDSVSLPDGRLCNVL